MTDINEYLTKLSQQLVVPESEIKKINASINFLKEKIWGLFQNRLHDVIVFGSYDRGTMLPQIVDKGADVDILVIFKKDEFQPQTYLNQLRSFSEKIYPKSSVFPQHPSIVVELEEVRFELVPAVSDRDSWSNSGLLIPAPPSKDFKWRETNPVKFKKRVLDKNEQEKDLVIPLLKLIKYWNVIQGGPFTSYYLEYFATGRSYPKKNLKEFFYEIINDLANERHEPKERKAIDALHERRRRLKVFEKENIFDYIEQELTSFLPLIK
jgi:predicted nucleotidyltransferase